MSYGTPKVGDNVVRVEHVRLFGSTDRHFKDIPGTVTKVGRKYFEVKSDQGTEQYNLSNWALTSSTDYLEIRTKIFPSKEVYDQHELRRIKIKEIRVYCNNKGCLEELSTDAIGIIHNIMYRN
jgi:hypothetical protein